MKGLAAAAVAGSLVLLIGCDDGGNTAEVGSLVPDKPVELLAQKGKTVSPRDFKGKVVVLDFWATWCGPCKAFMPHLQSMYNEYHSKGLEVMSVSTESREKVAAFRKSVNYTFPAYLDSFELLSHAFNVSAIPHLAVIDRDGKITFDGVADERAVRDAVQKAIG